MFQTFQFCRATGRSVKRFFQRIAKKLAPKGSFKITAEFSIPPFIKLSVEYTSKSPKGPRK